MFHLFHPGDAADVLRVPTVSSPRACKCGRFLSGLDVDDHSSCSNCRDFKYAQSDPDTCSSWDDSWWLRVWA